MYVPLEQGRYKFTMFTYPRPAQQFTSLKIAVTIFFFIIYSACLTASGYHAYFISQSSEFVPHLYHLQGFDVNLFIQSEE